MSYFTYCHCEKWMKWTTKQSSKVMLNLFQHLFIKRFRNKFGMTRYWITSSFHCLGLFGISQNRGFAPSYGLTPYQKFALRSKKCCEIIKQIEKSNRFFALFGRNKRHRSNLNQKAWFLIINFRLSHSFVPLLRLFRNSWIYRYFLC